LLARTYIERGLYEEADYRLRDLETNNELYSKVKREIPKIRANSLIKQKQYSAAIEPLTLAIKKSKKRRDKARMNFILGQLHQRESNFADAAASFNKAARMTNNYELGFYSKLNLATNLAKQSGVAKGEEALNKMKADRKNADHICEIYFALAQLAFEDSRIPEGIALLKKAIQNSKGDSPEKTEAYLSLAELFYKQDKFVPAKAYYDSTLISLPKQDDRYARVKSFAENLDAISKNLVIIQDQDSLLRIAAFSPKEKKEFVQRLKKEKEKLLQKEANAENLLLNKVPPSVLPPAGVNPANQGGGGVYFAYNPTSLINGKREFQKLWGNRILEDNWRRSKKKPTGGVVDQEVLDSTKTVQDLATSEEDLASFLKGIPATPDEIALAESKKQQAMFTLGGLYREKLQNPSKSIAILERLINEYPNNPHLLDSYYQLYQAYTEIKNDAKAKYYYDLLTTKFPSSTYARVLTDPDFRNLAKKKEKEIENYYLATLSEFNNRNFSVAYKRSISSDSLFTIAHNFRPKFGLIAAMSTGNLKGKPAYITALKDLISKYPNTEEQKKAKEILRLFGEYSGQEDLPTGQNEDEINFKVEDDAQHYVIAILKDKNPDIEKVKVYTTNYITQYHKNESIRVTSVFLEDLKGIKTPIIVMRSFENKSRAMSFYRGVKTHETDFSNGEFKYDLFPISSSNYRMFLKASNPNSYTKFFTKNYGD
jgi:tetratricopeptide (TPR) repeat protein